jgi:hypothetical protein
MVWVDSGLSPLALLENVSRKRWKDLVYARCSYIQSEFYHDCRALVQWVQDAEKMWAALGYQSADDMIAQGYKLEPEEIRLAARWLEINNPDREVGLGEVLTKVQKVARDNPEPLRAGPGNPTGANQHTKRNCDEKEKRPNSCHGSNSASERVQRLRRDCPEAVERLERGEFGNNVAAAERWARGEEPHPPRKQATPAEQVRRLVKRLAEDMGGRERADLAVQLRALADQLEEKPRGKGK